jgi:hypothetical protein
LSDPVKQLAPKNPALLCYYFLFPGHDESLPEPCDKQETGKEYASFGGEWACMAILLGREDVSESYLPKFIGHTARFNAGTRQGLDSEHGIGMTVRKWRERTDVHAELLPRTIGDHPLIWVSRGVHSLYLQPGTKIIQPYLPKASPVGCGQFDSPHALEQFEDSLAAPEEDGSPAGAWAKIVGGLFLGGLPGLIAGAVLTALEGLPTGVPVAKGLTGAEPDAFPPVTPATDVVEEPGTFSGVIVGPRDFLENSQKNFPGADFVAWMVQQNLSLEIHLPGYPEIQGRHYDFIVDRTKQIWWPSDDWKSGYRGRWGPLVVDDPFRRRSGMNFPDFWIMFFVALAKNQ